MFEPNAAEYETTELKFIDVVSLAIHLKFEEQNWQQHAWVKKKWDDKEGTKQFTTEVAPNMRDKTGVETCCSSFSLNRIGLLLILLVQWT